MSDMTEWWWVRHGPTGETALTGWRDIPADLSDEPRLQRLRAYLPDNALVVSSDLTRATATADALAGNRARLPPTPALREFHFGAWEGLTHDQVTARDPELCRAYWETPGDVAPPGGESWNKVAARVGCFVAELNRRHPGCPIIAVAHFGVILTQVQAALGISPAAALAYRIDTLSVTRLCLQGDTWRIGVINHVP